MDRNRKAGFTLIELLVVIAVIAVLISILVPALSRAREQAQAVKCLINLKGLAFAWTIYAQESKDYLVGPLGWTTSQKPNDWVHHPVQPGETGYFGGMTAHQQEVQGIRNGALFSYVEDLGEYHCPADRTWSKVTTSTYTVYMSPYRSYAISDALNGGWFTSLYVYKKLTAIPEPFDKLALVEEEDGPPGQLGANWGSWVLPKNPQTFTWWDPISLWHGRATNMAFADMHAESHKWKDQSTFDMAAAQQLQMAPYAGEGDDLRWVRRAFHNDYRNSQGY